MNLTKARSLVENQTEDFINLITILNDDLKGSWQLWNQNHESQFGRRTYIRTFCSGVEGMLFCLRRMVLMMHDLGVNKLTGAELLALQEQTFKLTDKGQVEIRPGNYVAAKTAFLFTVAMLEKTFGVDYLIDRGSAGFQAYLQILEVRNRITHPKSSTEFLISNDDVRHVVRAVEWFSIQSEEIPKRFSVERAFELLDQTEVFSKQKPK